jgi:hypothetical protein
MGTYFSVLTRAKCVVEKVANPNPGIRCGGRIVFDVVSKEFSGRSRVIEPMPDSRIDDQIYR